MSIVARAISSASRRSTCCCVRPYCPSRQPEAALEVIEQGLATTSRNSERIFEAELYRLKARALLFR